MNVSDYTCTVEQVLKLKSLGIVQPWRFHLGELMALLPKNIDHSFNTWSSYSLCVRHTFDGIPVFSYEDNDLSGKIEVLHSASGKTEAIAAADMLIWLIENNKLTVQELNEKISKS